MRISLEDQPIGVAGFRAFGIAVFYLGATVDLADTTARSAEMGENVSDMCVRKYRMFQHLESRSTPQQMFQHLESCASQLQ